MWLWILIISIEKDNSKHIQIRNDKASNNENNRKSEGGESDIDNDNNNTQNKTTSILTTIRKPGW